MTLSLRRAFGLALLVTILGFGVIEDSAGCEAHYESSTVERR